MNEESLTLNEQRYAGHLRSWRAWVMGEGPCVTFPDPITYGLTAYRALVAGNSIYADQTSGPEHPAPTRLRETEE